MDAAAVLAVFNVLNDDVANEVGWPGGLGGTLGRHPLIIGYSAAGLGAGPACIVAAAVGFGGLVAGDGMQNPAPKPQYDAEGEFEGGADGFCDD